jgi:hypothetical protein
MTLLDVSFVVMQYQSVLIVLIKQFVINVYKDILLIQMIINVKSALCLDV